MVVVVVVIEVGGTGFQVEEVVAAAGMADFPMVVGEVIATQMERDGEAD